MAFGGGNPKQALYTLTTIEKVSNTAVVRHALRLETYFFVHVYIPVQKFRVRDIA